MMTLNVKMSGFDEAEKMLAGVKNGIQRAASNAINKALIAGRAMASKSIRARYNIKARDIKAQGMSIQRATSRDVAGELVARGSMLPIVLFSPKVVKRGSPKRQFVRVSIKRGSRKLVRGGFLVSSAGKRQIFERRQDERLPIFPVFTIGVPQMIASLQVSKQIEERMNKIASENLARNALFYLNKAAAQAQSSPFKGVV